MPRPDLTRVPPFYHGYISKVEEEDLMTSFHNQSPRMFEFLGAIPENKHDYAYAEGKWTVKQLVQHMADAERVFAYRALSFARNDENSLPGFDENAWAAESHASLRNWNDLLEEFRAIRRSTEYLFSSFNMEQFEATGKANNNSIYVLGLGFICVGHCHHHLGILKERYL
jgi:hypothetical protein